MLGPLKRFFRNSAASTDLAVLKAWAERRGHRFRRARGDAGFVIEGLLEARPWRLEWGPSQRPYIQGHELRLRMALDLPSDQQMLLLSAPLMDSLERQTYDRFIDSVQTENGSDTPEEMRWLVMFPKVDLANLKGLDAHFGAVSSQRAVGRAWIEGSLAELLLHEAESGVLRGDPPLVVITLRGRTYLRLQLEQPNAAVIGAVLALFETVIAQAVRAADGVTDTSVGWKSGASSTWQSLQPAEQSDPRKRQ